MRNKLSESSTFFPFSFPCEVAVLRGELKHSHLDNGYINLPPSCLLDVIAPNEAISHQRALELYQQILNGLDDGFSPALLIDLLVPFKIMTSEDRKKIKDALQTIYEQRFKPREKKELLKKAGDEFFSSLGKYLKVRKEQPEIESDDDTYKTLKTAAIKFRDALELLPKGIWMP